MKCPKCQHENPDTQKYCGECATALTPVAEAQPSFTKTLKHSTNGWVRFSYPAIFENREVIDVELWFEDGQVVKEKASKGQEFLTETLNTDDGARILGELGIGTNYGIKRFTKNMLFDEKIGGTIHIAVGGGFPECHGRNESAIHWDMLCDMSEDEIIVDGEVFYKNGKFVKQGENQGKTRK